MLNDKKFLLRIFAMLRGYQKKIIIIATMLLVCVLLNLVLPMMQKELMDNGLLKADLKIILYVLLFILVIQQVTSMISLLIERNRINLVSSFRFKLEEMAFCHLLRVKAEYFNNVGQSELLSRIDVDINYICNIMNTNTLSAVSSILMLIGGIVSVFLIDVRMSLVFIIVLPIRFLIVHFHVNVQKKKLNVFLNKSTKYARWFGEFVTGILNIRIFGIESKKRDQFANMANDKISAQKDLEMLSQYRQLADSLFYGIWNAIAFIVGGVLIVNNELTVGSLYAFLSYSSYVLGPLSSLLNIKVIFSGITPSATRFFEFLDIREENGNELTENYFQTKRIELRDVSFAYNANFEHRDILNEFNLDVGENSKVAIIGMNGTGKTTIINLLLRLYDYESGLILFDGNDINELNLQEYRRQFSIVSQNVYLFNDTIWNNVCLYNDFDKDVLLKVLEYVGLRELAEEKGLDFVIGINGSYLSGGQRQKMSLARALIHDRPIFIFDEATSNTDIMFDTQFRKIIRERLKDKTVIIITHNVELLREVDSIVLIEDGRNVCQDSFNNLMKNNNRFIRVIQEYIKLESRSE